MGREQTCLCTIGEATATATALLETNELILRGPLKRRFALASLTAVTVDGDALKFLTETGPVALHLGHKQAESWAKKIVAPAPSLAAKLGISPDHPVWVIGVLLDDALARCVNSTPGLIATDPQCKGVALAEVRHEDELIDAEASYRALSHSSHLWVAHAKGKSPAISGDRIREILRGMHYIDTKVCSVSPTTTATRYSRVLS